MQTNKRRLGSFLASLAVVAIAMTGVATTALAGDNGNFRHEGCEYTDIDSDNWNECHGTGVTIRRTTFTLGGLGYVFEGSGSSAFASLYCGNNAYCTGAEEKLFGGVVGTGSAGKTCGYAWRPCREICGGQDSCKDK